MVQIINTTETANWKTTKPLRSEITPFPSLFFPRKMWLGVKEDKNTAG